MNTNREYIDLEMWSGHKNLVYKCYCVPQLSPLCVCFFLLKNFMTGRRYSLDRSASLSSECIAKCVVNLSEVDSEMKNTPLTKALGEFMDHLCTVKLGYMNTQHSRMC